VTVLAFSSSLPKANFERAVDSDVHREFALLRKDLGDSDVEGPDWVAFERLPWLRLVLQVRQPGDAVSLEHTVKRGARQVLDGRLERIKTIIEWQQRELCGKATQAASCSADSTSERASCAPSACLPRTCVCAICEPFSGSGDTAPRVPRPKLSIAVSLPGRCVWSPRCREVSVT